MECPYWYTLDFLDKEGTTAIAEKYRNILKKTKQARVGQIILSGILPVFGMNGCTL